MGTIQKIFLLLLALFPFISAMSQTNSAYTESSDPYLTNPMEGNWGKLHYAYGAHFPIVAVAGFDCQYLGYVSPGQPGAGVYVELADDFTQYKGDVFLISDDGNKVEMVRETPKNLMNNYLAIRSIESGMNPNSKDLPTRAISSNFDSTLSTTTPLTITREGNTDTFKIKIPEGLYRGLLRPGRNVDLSKNKGQFVAVPFGKSLTDPAEPHYWLIVDDNWSLLSEKAKRVNLLDANTQKQLMREVHLSDANEENKHLDFSGTWKGETKNGDWTGTVELYIKKTEDYSYVGVTHIIWNKAGEQPREVKKKFNATLVDKMLNVSEYEFIQKPPGGGALANFSLQVDNSTGELKLYSPYPLTRSNLSIPKEYEDYINK